MQYVKLSLPPGVRNHGTEYQCSNRWLETNLVRWESNALMPVGGWTEFTELVSDGQGGVTAQNVTVNTATYSVPRSSHAWFADDGGASDGTSYYLASGTSSHLIIHDGTGAFTNITPTAYTAGVDTPESNVGFGGGYYGRESYGVERNPELGVTIQPTTWTLDNYGENLIGVANFDKTLYEWTPSVGGLATAISNAPLCNGVVATAERFIFALGADSASGPNVRRVAWCDREDPTVWTPSTTNEAGGIELATTGALVCGLRVRSRTLLLTTTDAHIAQYSGPPLVYGFTQIGTNCGVISNRAACTAGSSAFWMGNDEFYVYNGSTVTQIPCEVKDYVFQSLNYNYRQRIVAIPNQKNNEVWWFYPSSNQTENDRYVAYDYAENIWIIGNLSRATGVDSGVFKNPIWITPTGDYYRHEIPGTTHGSETPYAETGPISLGNGDQVIRAIQVVPDDEPSGDLQLTFKTRFYPQGDETTNGPYTIANPTDVRFTGRQMRMRVDDISTGGDWRLGDMRVLLAGGGRR